MSRRPQANSKFPLRPGPINPIVSLPGQSTNVDSQTQLQFMYMFERLSEPLYFGPRGDQNAYFMVDAAAMDENTKRTAALIRQGLTQAAIVSTRSFNVKMPRSMPNLQSIGNACKRSEIFSYFLPSHKQAANELADILIAQPTQEDFLSMSCLCRDSPMVNSELWVHATVRAALKRKDMRGIRIPAIWEVMPDLFISTPIRKFAQAQASIPMLGRAVLKINGNNINSTEQREEKGKSGPPEVKIDVSFTGRNENPENKLWYFRKDFGVASHHWHWHVVYSGDSPAQGAGSRDRKGELFYYMHHSMLARYDAERLFSA